MELESLIKKVIQRVENMFFYITKDDTTELMVILNLFQDLSAEKDKKRLAVRC